MIKNTCYCDKCEMEIKEDTSYFKVDIFKRKWHSIPDESENDKTRSVPHRKLHLCDACMEKILKDAN